MTEQLAAASSGDSLSKDATIKQHRKRIVELLQLLHHDRIPEKGPEQPEKSGEDSSSLPSVENTEAAADPSESDQTTPQRERDVFWLDAIEMDSNDQEPGPVSDELLIVKSWSRIHQSDELFREICCVLRELATTSASLFELDMDRDAGVAPRKGGDERYMSDLFAPLDMSLLALESLQHIRRERELVVVLTDDITKRDKKEAQAKEKNKGWGFPSFQGLARLFFPSMRRQDEQAQTENDAQSGTLAHNDPTIGPTPELFKKVLRSMLASFASLVAPSESQNGDQDALFRKEAAQRLIKMLHMLTEDRDQMSGLDSVQKQKILEFLWRLGTLETAKWSNTLYHILSSEMRHSLIHQQQGDPELIVWRTYVEAAKNQSCSASERDEAVRQLYQLWLHRWNSQFPSSRDMRTEQVSIVLSAIGAIGYAENALLNDEFQQAAQTIIRRYMGRDSSARFWRRLESGRLLRGIDLRFVDALTRVFACHDIDKAHNLMMALTSETNHTRTFPTVDTINIYLKGLLHHHERVGRSTSNRDPAGDVEFVMSLLDMAMSRRDLGGLPTQEAFELSSRLLTILSPPKVGQSFVSWLSLYEIRGNLGGNSMKLGRVAKFNQVLWGLWQEAKNPSSEDGDQNQFSCCQEAWDILTKMESVSTPLLMSPSENHQSGQSQQDCLYNVHVQPTKRTYEIVLSVCADTCDPSEFERAASIAVDVVELAKRNGVVLNSDAVENTIAACKARVTTESASVKVPSNTLHTSAENGVQDVAEAESGEEHAVPDVAEAESGEEHAVPDVAEAESREGHAVQDVAEAEEHTSSELVAETEEGEESAELATNDSTMTTETEADEALNSLVLLDGRLVHLGRPSHDLRFGNNAKWAARSDEPSPEALAKTKRKRKSKNLGWNIEDVGHLAATNKQDDDELNKEDLQKLTVVMLKEKLRGRGLKVSGRKAELIKRLVENQ